MYANIETGLCRYLKFGLPGLASLSQPQAQALLSKFGI